MVPVRSTPAHRPLGARAAHLCAIGSIAIVLAACSPTGAIGSPSPPSAAGVVSPSPSVTAPASATPGATPSASETPAATPTIASTSTPAPTGDSGEVPTTTCTKLPYLRGTDFEAVRFADVRVGTHPSYDRIVFQFAAGKFPDIEVRTVKPPFKLDPSDLPVTIAGDTFLRIRLNHVAVETIPAEANDIQPGYPILVELRQTTGYEGDAVWIAGLSGPACVAMVSILKAPARLVIDVWRVP
jgi:hypothetical protein